MQNPIQQYRDRLLEILDTSLSHRQLASFSLEEPSNEGHRYDEKDFDVRVSWKGGKARLGVHVKDRSITSADIQMNAQLAMSILQHGRDRPGSSIPVLAAPFIGPKHALLAKHAPLCFFDLAGNCYFAFGPFLIERQGRRNLFPRRSFQDSIFAPKATRMIRVLLLRPDQDWRVTRLAAESQVSSGYAVKVCERLVDLAYVEQRDRKYRLVRGRDLIIDWALQFRFPGGGTIRRFIVLGDPEHVEEQFCKACSAERLSYALTLFAGARHRAPFVRHPAVHAYMQGGIERIIEKIHAKEVSDGGNLLIVTPRDPGVFYGATQANGFRIVSDVQLYVDLFNFEARGREQAEDLLQRKLPHFASKETSESRALLQSLLQLRDSADDLLRRKEWAKAAEQFRQLRNHLAHKPYDLASSEFPNALLKWWISLAHLGFETRDEQVLEKARSLCPTEREVEKLTRQVGYNSGLALLARLAYYAGLFVTAKDPLERQRYWEKVKNHFTIANSPYTESHSEIASEAQKIYQSAMHIANREGLN
jgi:hypothetical protein